MKDRRNMIVRNPSNVDIVTIVKVVKGRVFLPTKRHVLDVKVSLTGKSKPAKQEDSFTCPKNASMTFPKTFDAFIVVHALAALVWD